mgnify:CR=1 FL=1
MSLLSRLAVQAARAYGILSSADKTKVVADYLVVAGGGGGGSNRSTNSGGGGGAGGLLTSTATLSTLNTYSIVVGAGGTGSTSSGVNGVNGSTSSLSGTGLTTVTTTGGGGGGDNQSGSNGGSGGGGGAGTSTRAGGTGVSGQGFAGGAGVYSGQYCGGGGGGSSTVGADATSSVGGNGGAGTASSISGSSVTYAGGGGGGASGTATYGTGGSGGGGAGANNTNSPTNGTTNTGGGGGGVGYGGAGYKNGADGGSGIVIISYTSATPKFVGGTITTSGGKQIHTFTSSGTLSPLTPVTASYLVVAGGGSGGIGYAGGGGAGGLLTGSTTLYSGATYVVTVGAGGTATGSNVAGGVGGNSVLSGTGLTTLTSTGGGGGAGFTSGQVATAGGSGGGGMYSSLGGYGNPTGGAGTSGQGYAGGTPSGTGGYFGGGGGGASAVGANGSGSSDPTSTGGNGGAGTASSITGSSVTYAGGGGGGARNGGTAGTGGSGGGGAGSKTSSVGATSGTANTGGGGGGACDGVTTAAAGGSGVVIISYAGSQVFNGGLVTSSGGNTIHTFNATGALTPLTNNLNNSLRFRSSASAYLSKTLGTPTNSYIWTYSAWFKRGTLGVAQTLFEAWAANNNTQYCAITITSSDTLTVSGWTLAWRTTTQVFRDPSAWYHLVVAVDTTQATGANRVKVYINGNQVTAFGTSNDPTQNTTTGINTAIAHSIGSEYSGTRYQYFDGYNADINFIDGQQLEPYYFGNNDAYGNWKPIKYTGMYGTNGFYLTFGNTTSTTTLGYDSSPNGNNWTTNNISLTAGTTYDAMTDVPTNTSATVANYATLNPLVRMTTGVGVSVSPTISNGNLTAVPTTNNNGTLGSFGVSSGKWYWEVNVVTGTVSNNAIIGITYTPSTSLISGGGIGYEAGGNKVVNGTSTSYGASTTTGDVIGVALDADASTVTFYKNNTSQGSISYTATDPLIYPSYFGGGGVSCNHAFNFGQRPFSYSAPTGYVALNTYNLPTPTILQGNKYMDATTYTGTGTTQVIVNQGQFQPDFVWMKGRSGATDHALYDIIRGVTLDQASNTQTAQSTQTTGLTAFNSNGFTIGSLAKINTSAATYIGWQWKAGSTGVSNTSGTITSTVSANTTAGFSTVGFTIPAAGGGTIGHGLGVAPKMVTIKIYNQTENYRTYHTSLGAGGAIYWNLTDAFNTADNIWNSVAPTSSVFNIKTGYFPSGWIGVAYCWAEIAGFSKFGSYTGNGSADGTFVYTGFRPKYIMVKKSSGIDSWALYDTTRQTYNGGVAMLLAEANDAEYTATYLVDILSNGFKFRATNGIINASGSTYIYMAFAENPFKNSNAR